MEKREFVATAYVIWEEKVLLLFHKKFQKWMPPGGHLEENETPVECVHREVMEETGLEVEIISQDNVVVDQPNAKSLSRPYLCLLEEIPKYKDVEAHQHIDSIYLTKPIEDKPIVRGEEGTELRWFTLEELDALDNIFIETKDTIVQIFADLFSETV